MSSTSTCGVKRAPESDILDRILSKRTRVDSAPADERGQILQLLLPSSFCDSIVGIIDDLLMSVDEAVVKAAMLGRVARLKKLLKRPGSYTNAEAALAAGRNGQLEALKILYDRYCYGGCSITWQILEAAAERGDADVVRFASKRINKYGAYQNYQNTALSHAICRGDAKMMDILLDPQMFRWDFTEAVRLAIDKKQDAMVGMMHSNFPKFVVGVYRYDEYVTTDSLIASMARGGHLDCVTYLYEHGLWELEGLGCAFVDAAHGRYQETLEFLNDTGVISPPAFDKAFVAAASGGSIDTVKYLYEQQRVSVEALNEAFEKTDNMEVAMFLYDTNLVLIDSLKKVFQRRPSRNYGGHRVDIVNALMGRGNIPDEVVSESALSAANCGDVSLVRVFYKAQRYSEEEILDAFKTAITNNYDGVVEVLCQAGCISDEILTEGFLESARLGHSGIVKHLLDLKRVPSDIITSAFVTATKRWKSAVVKLLFKDQHASAEVICDLFERAVRTGHFPVARALIQSPHVSQAMKDQTLLTVARRDQSGVMKFIEEADCWSQETLKQAFNVSSDHSKVRRMLRRRIRT